MPVITHAMNAGANTYTYTTPPFSAADATRVQAYLTARFGAGTAEQLWQRYGKNVAEQLKANVLDFERQPAVVPELPIT